MLKINWNLKHDNRTYELVRMWDTGHAWTITGDVPYV